MWTERLTHDYHGELVVFLIGCTINKIHRPDHWWPMLTAMPRMLRELSAEPDSGLLGYRLLLEGRNPVVVQYWDSLEKLYSYAADQDAEHRPAWRAFNKRAGKSPDSVGIWHETFVVDSAESIYNATGPLGLAKSTAAVPVGRAGNRARSRLHDTRR